MIRQLPMSVKIVTRQDIFVCFFLMGKVYQYQRNDCFRVSSMQTSNGDWKWRRHFRCSLKKQKKFDKYFHRFCKWEFDELRTEISSFENRSMKTYCKATLQIISILWMMMASSILSLFICLLCIATKYINGQPMQLVAGHVVRSTCS